MNTYAHYRFGRVQLGALPVWAAPLILMASILMIAVLSLVGLAVLALLLPIVLVASAVTFVRSWFARRSVDQEFNRYRAHGPIVINGEYRVIDDPTKSTSGPTGKPEPHRERH